MAGAAGRIRERAGEAARIVRACRSSRQLAAQAQSLHAPDAGSLPAGARVVVRFARSGLAR